MNTNQYNLPYKQNPNQMSLSTKPNSKVIFTGDGSYYSEIEFAFKILSYGEIYTVKQICIDSYSSDVELVEFPNEFFDCAMFENAS